jgi:hypothetical protein
MKQAPYQRLRERALDTESPPQKEVLVVEQGAGGGLSATWPGEGHRDGF